MSKKTIGIIGGMGPLATADLFRKIAVNTKATTDQEHIKILIDNNTDIPDRTEAIVNNGKSPLPQLIKSAMSLWVMGADMLVMPCNTAHFFLPELQKSIDIPIISMVEVTAVALRNRGVKKVGLMATSGTLSGGVYNDTLGRYGLEIVPHSSGEQAIITDLIYKGVKAGREDYDTSSFRGVMDALFERGAETLVLACTELPVAMEMYKLDYNVCDPTLELARAAIIAAGGECT